jgi:hypothetical protein
MTLGGAESKQQISPIIQKQISTNKLSATQEKETKKIQNSTKMVGSCEKQNGKRDQIQAEIKTDILSPK